MQPDERGEARIGLASTPRATCAAHTPAQAHSAAALDPRPSFGHPSKKADESSMPLHGSPCAAPTPSRYRRARSRSRRQRRTSGLFARPSAFADGIRRRGSARASRRHSGRSRARAPARPRARHTHRAPRACPVRAPGAALSAAPRRARAGSTARRARRARRATQPRRAVSPRRDKSPSLAGPRRS